MRRLLVGRKFGTHAVTCLSAELRSFHVLDRAVCKLSSYKHVYERRNPEKPEQPADGPLAVKFLGNEALLEAPLSKVHANRNQEQTHKKI